MKEHSAKEPERQGSNKATNPRDGVLVGGEDLLDPFGLLQDTGHGTWVLEDVGLDALLLLEPLGQNLLKAKVELATIQLAIKAHSLHLKLSHIHDLRGLRELARLLHQVCAKGHQAHLGAAGPNVNKDMTLLGLKFFGHPKVESG